MSTDTPQAAGATAPAARVVDLDAKRAARAEAHAEPVVLRLGGTDFELPAEMPAEFAFGIDDGRYRDAIVALLGDRDVEFFALKPSDDDIAELIRGVTQAYGVDLGEAPASLSS